MEEIILASAALALLEKLLPVIQQQVKTGQITPEEQQKIRDQYNSLRNQGDAAFAGPEWNITK